MRPCLLLPGAGNIPTIAPPQVLAVIWHWLPPAQVAPVALRFGADAVAADHLLLSPSRYRWHV